MKYRLIILPAILSLLVFYTRLSIIRIFPTLEYASWLITLGLFAVMIGSQIVYRLRHWPTESLFSRIFVWSGAIGIGLWATFILLSVAADLFYFLVVAVQLATSKDWQMQTLLHTLLVMVFAGSIMLSVIGLWQAAGGPVVKEVAIPITGLPQALAGLKIVQISDLHIGATIQRGYLENMVRKTMALEADIIAITGDVADGKPDELRMHLPPLAELKAPLGIYFITGNHEYYSGVELWIEEAKRLGFIPLINENRIVIYNGVNVMVAGVTDITAHQFLPEHRSDPAKAIASPTDVAFKLLLAHQPESCYAAEQAGFDLQLSGHTHAGQFFPFSLLVKWFKRYYRGLNRHGRMWLYVNAGTGYWGAANRFAVPSEITLIRLVVA